jgi:positive regulator of sigma E activity
VQIVLQEGVLLRSAMLMYVLPLLFLFAGAISGGQWAAEESRDMYSALGGLGGLFFSFVLVKGWTGRQRSRSVAQPAILPASDADI